MYIGAGVVLLLIAGLYFARLQAQSDLVFLQELEKGAADYANAPFLLL